MPGELAYAATKGAIEAFTTTLAAEVAPLGITVNAIDPGITDTGWITPDVEAAFLPGSSWRVRRAGGSPGKQSIRGVLDNPSKLLV
jgi:NAD(P)-dependent dehydrogenase (short-subunit alcohol dehydrogenase family)